ncbi:MAG TPA: hypothetical protein VIL34_10520 [Actinopolymorphaceae bacterium]
MFELGLRRIREELGLEPVEFPTTRKMGASPPARAEDIHAALSDPEITVLMASIAATTRSPYCRIWIPIWCERTPSRSSVTPTTPTSSPTCGSSGS